MFSSSEPQIIDKKSSLPELDQQILKYWQSKNLLSQLSEQNKNKPPFVFYDGPPFPNGCPHFGHICVSVIKDTVCRFASQTGYSVYGKIGWDCHGLPIEYQVNKRHQIKDKSEVEKMGIQKYNNFCHELALIYISYWQNCLKRFGRWIDFKNDYRTSEILYMQSVWQVFKKLYQKGLVYKATKVIPYSLTLHTPLSQMQAHLNYKQANCNCAWVSFPIVNSQSKLIVYTKQIWTLVCNLAIVVNSDMTYVKVKDFARNEVFILGEQRLRDLYRNKHVKEYEILDKFKGSELVGRQYVPIFQYYESRRKNGCFQVLSGNVADQYRSSGLEHCYPSFNQAHYNLCLDHHIIEPNDCPNPIDQVGKFTKQIPQFEGIHIFDDQPTILKTIKNSQRLISSQTQKSNYPFCWRSDKRLINKLISAWFINVSELKQKIQENIAQSKWNSEFIKQKRFTSWVKDCQDWCFSRDRFWGNPIPLWISGDGEEIVCVGSIRQLEELTGQKITDLHRQNLDNITIQSKQGKGKLKRIQQVFDCWFQSGCMPYSQSSNLLFKTQKQLTQHFPANLIVEGIDQTRGWFYVLNVIAAGLNKGTPFKNVIVNGLVLRGDNKWQKKFYVDPMQVCQKYGADAMRLYFLSSSIVIGQSLIFSQYAVEDQFKNTLLPWKKLIEFFIEIVADLEKRSGQRFVFVEHLQKIESDFQVLDRWILSQLNTLIPKIRYQMSNYKLNSAISQFKKLIQNIKDWYVRLSLDTLKSCKIKINILFEVFLKTNILMSPFIPFITEHCFQNLKKYINKTSNYYVDSIHLLQIPEHIKTFELTQLNQNVSNMINIIQISKNLRQIKKVDRKTQINSLTIITNDKLMQIKLAELVPYIFREVKIKDIFFNYNYDDIITLSCRPNLPIMGPRLRNNNDFRQIRTKIADLTKEQIQNLQQKGQIQIITTLITINDVIITKKCPQAAHEYEAIGGVQIIVLIDTRQVKQIGETQKQDVFN